MPCAEKCAAFSRSPVECLYFVSRMARQGTRADHFHCVPEGEEKKGRLKRVSCRKLHPPPDLSTALLAARLSGLRHYFHIVLLNATCPYLLASPRTATEYHAAPGCTALDWTEEVHWSSIRWNMELSEWPSLPQLRGTLHRTVWGCCTFISPALMRWVFYFHCTHLYQYMSNSTS